jgi:hypothetical protein
MTGTGMKKKTSRSVKRAPRRRGFDYSLDYERLDARERPEIYRAGVGEQGVLLVEPYKSEILPHWRFATPELAYVRLGEEHKAKYGG